MELQELANRLRRSEVFSGKRSIDFVRSAFGDAFASSGIANGDDTAAGDIFCSPQREFFPVCALKIPNWPDEALFSPT